MLALVLKLTLAPALVATATRVAGRLGHRAGGLVGGLPVVAGPILLIYAVEQGQDFAAEAAAGAVLGIVSLVGFCVAYTLAARNHGTVTALAAGWAAFGAGTAAFAAVDPPLAVSTAVSLVAVAGGSVALHRMTPDNEALEPGPDLLTARLAVTAVLVLGLTAVAGELSPHLAGLLPPSPSPRRCWPASPRPHRTRAGDRAAEPPVHRPRVLHGLLRAACRADRAGRRGVGVRRRDGGRAGPVGRAGRGVRLSA